MSEPNPPPPKVGDTYYHKVRKLYRGKYHVRAIVDAEKDKEYGWLYKSSSLVTLNARVGSTLSKTAMP